MPGQIPEEFINDLRHRTDIVDIIGEHVPLKKQGQNYTGLCPFHPEKTPSFVVSPHKQIFHCFGCGKGGDVFSFLMDKSGFSFFEAVAYLAKRCGMELPAQDTEKDRHNSLRQRYYHINEIAAQFYQKALRQPMGREALEYLQGRGLKPDTLEKFMLGYAPGGWDFLNRFLLEQGISEQEILTLGLAVKSRRGTLVDRFRNRVIFPIFNETGKIAGFGGRVLDDGLPKYLNSPDTPLFYKGKYLYGLHLAKGNMRSQDRAVLMEGYMDVITAHQHGIVNAAGTLGTALTVDQARLLMRFTYHVCLCFDADAAGQKAAYRGMDILHQEGCQVTVMTIPGSKDPDEYLRTYGGKGFQELLEKAPPLLEYKLNHLLQSHNPDTIPGKIQVIQALVPDLRQIQSPVARQAFIQLIADRLIIPETAIHAELRKSLDAQPVKENSGIVDQRTMTQLVNGLEKAQGTLIRYILERPLLLQEVEKWGGKNLFSHPLLKEIYQVNYLMRQAGHNIKANDLISHLDNVQARQLLTQTLLEEDISTEWERIAKDCLMLLKIENLNQNIKEKSALMAHLEKNGDVSRSLELMTQIQQLLQEKQSLATTLRKGGNDIEN